MDYTFDLQRIFFGNAPPSFFIEIFFRTVIIFIYTLVALRFVGNRGASQLTLFEFSIVLGLGSAMGDAMFYPEVPLAHSLVVITLLVAIIRVILYFANRSGKLESLVEGHALCVVIDGKIHMPGIRAGHLSVEDIYMEMRHHKIDNLGMVKRAYFEKDGEISIFPYPKGEEKEGDSVLPEAVGVNASVKDVEGEAQARSAG